jgi:signal transduction histidine kinase/ActR/RegA family two-component response regulator
MGVSWTARRAGMGAAFPLFYRRLFGLALLLLVGCAPTDPVATPRARHGVLDLRQVDLKTQQIALNGTWRWTWHQLREPGEPATAQEFTEFPQIWNRARWRGQPVAPQGYATYELLVLLPRNPGPISIRMPDVYSSYRLFINGVTELRNGKPGTRAATTVPFWSWKYKRYDHPPDTLHLLLQIANFHHSKGGPKRDIVLGNAERIREELNFERAIDFFLMGCLFMGGLFFLGLYLFGRQDRAILFFALFCLCYSYRIVGSDQYALHSLVGQFNWFVTLRLEYLSLFVGVALFVRYTRTLYPADTHRYFTLTLEIVSYGFAALVVLTVPRLFTQLINPFLGLMFVSIAYASYVYGVAARRNRLGAWFSLASTALLLAVLLTINLEYFGAARASNVLLFAGYVGFFFLQSLVLSYRFAYTLHQARLQAEEGLRAKGDFLSTMSHEIRTPLNAIVGTSHLLLADQPRPDQQEHLDVLLFSANNLMNIVNDILDFTKIEAGKISLEAIPMDLAALARNVVAGYRSSAAEKGLTLTLRLDESLPTTVQGDPTRTAQVLINLIHNAIKFTQQGGVDVSLTVGAQTERDARVRIAVKDTGLGIPRHKQQQIFERFTQADTSTSRRFGGTGLGLAICKRILELQHVSLQLHSEVGRGSTFFFVQTFPKVKPATPAAPVPDAPTTVRTRPLAAVEVLLVEDTPMNVRVAQGLIERWGGRVDVATNGQEALDRLDPLRHQLVLMDLHMPVMDGYEATRRLRARGETLPIIALTASLSSEVNLRAPSTGLDGIVVKPFKPDELLQVLLAHLRTMEARR